MIGENQLDLVDGDAVVLNVLDEAKNGDMIHIIWSILKNQHNDERVCSGSRLNTTYKYKICSLSRF